MSRYYRMLIAIAMLLSSLLPLAQVAHAQHEQCYGATNQCIGGRFLEYWQGDGGLSVFGFPISPGRQERNRDTGKIYLTQWFERNRFELHPENARPYDVLLGRLGEDALVKQGRNWRTFQPASPSSPHYFSQTGHAIAHAPFWTYWSTQGLEFDGRGGTSLQESLALWGLPLSEPTMETNSSGDRVLTQWFERARFEDHGAKGVLLGLLGNELIATPSPLPPPPAARLQYLWPQTSPLTVWPRDSYAKTTEWMLHLAYPHATKPDATISGGAAVSPPEGNGRRVTVRGLTGSVYGSDSGLTLVWIEQGTRYMIDSRLRESEIVALANDLTAIDRQTFKARLEQAQPSPSLKYFWPSLDQQELSVFPEPHGGSFADQASFKLNLYRVHSTRPDVTITGGALVVPPQRAGQAVIIRGQRGTAYNDPKGYTLVWIEEGQRYMVISDFTLPDLLDFAGTLQVINLETFRTRIQPE